MEINKVKNITYNVLNRLLKEGVIKENMFEDSGFEDYKNNYNDTNFNPFNINKHDLIKFCQNYGDFLYIYDSIKGWRISGANSSEIINEIINDIYHCAYVEPTHKFDYLLSNREDLFEGNYISVLMLKGIEEEYAIIYMQEK